MDKKWRKSIFQLLPLDGRNFLTVALKRVEFRENVGSFPMDKGNCNNIRVKWVSVKRGFEKCTVSGKIEAVAFVGAFVKSEILTNEPIFYLGGTFEFRKHNVFGCSVILRLTLFAKQPSEADVPPFKPSSLKRLSSGSLDPHKHSYVLRKEMCGMRLADFAKTELIRISLIKLGPSASLSKLQTVG